MFEDAPEIKPNKYKRFIFDCRKNKEFAVPMYEEQFNKIFAKEMRIYSVKLDIPERKYRNKIFFDSLCRMRNYLLKEIDAKIEVEIQRIKSEYSDRMSRLDVAVGKYESLKYLQENCPKIMQAIWAAS